MNDSHSKGGNALQSKGIGSYYERLRKVCESDNKERKVQIAEKMAKRIDEIVILSLLEELAKDTYSCKMQAILTMSKVKDPNEDVLRILAIFLNDDNYYIRVEASRILTGFAEMHTPNLDKLAEKLMKGGHELKIRALKIYEQIWKSYPEQTIRDIGEIASKENDYIILKGIIDLLGEIGKTYPKEITELLRKLLPTLKSTEKGIVLDSITKFANDHPNEALSLLSQIERSGDISSKLIPNVLLLTVDMLPKKTFELLKKLARNNNKSVRFSVMKSLVYFKKTYPGETLEVLFELWQVIGDEKPRYRGDECITHDQVKSLFVRVGMNQPSKALSFLQQLSVCNDAIKRKNAMEATSELASEAPSEAFSLLAVFLQDSDYKIKKSVILSLNREWNTFSEKTISLLESIMKEEIEKLRKEIEGIFFSINKVQSSEAKVLLKKLGNGDLKTLLDIIYETTSHFQMDKEKVPEELLLDGTLRIQKEAVLCLKQNRIENCENALELLRELSTAYSVWIQIIALRILPQFLPKNLNVVLEILEELVNNDVSQVREEALDFVVELLGNYPENSLKIIKNSCCSKNKSVRADIVKKLYHFKRYYPEDSFLLLKSSAKDPDPDVRKQVALSVTEYMDDFPQEILELTAKLCMDPDDSVFRAAFDFLEKLKERNKRDILFLLENLHANSNPAVREKTATFLGTFEKGYSERIIRILEDLSRDQIGSVRSSAFSSFDKISIYQPEKAREILTALAREMNPEIRGRVVRSIGVLSQSDPLVDIDVLEQFLQDDDVSVKIELALTLGKMGRNNPRKATNFFRKMLLLARNDLLKEAIADAMADYGRYCPYEAMKILSYLSNSFNENISRKIESSFYIIRKKIENFSCISQNCFRESFLNLKKAELSSLLEMILKKMTYEEEDSYMKEIIYRYKLYHNLLRFSTISRIHTSESLLAKHIENFELIDEGISSALPALKNITRHLGKQNFYAKRDDKIENLKDCLDLIEKTERQFEKKLMMFDQPDRFMLQSILMAWKDIISIEFVKLRGKAELKIILESKESVKRETTTVRLKLINEGISKAENVIISIHTSRDFTVVGPPDRHLKILSPNDPAKNEFHIKVKEGYDSVRVSFAISFDDAEKSGKNLTFADQITFIEKNKEYKEIKNPYIAGIPLRTPKMFYGRNKLLKKIESTLKMTNTTHVLIFHGQRRTGKTSILYQLKIRLENNFLPVILDFQGMTDSGTGNFFYWMIREICNELSRKNIEMALPDEVEFNQKPAFYFRDVFLQEVKRKLGNRKIILMMDEFETIDDKIREKKIDKDILVFMRNLMQHSENIDFIFSGTHQLEEMSSDYWSILFNIGLYNKISFLEQNEAVQLICDPVKEYMEYDPLAVEKILEMTAGHPYFVQLICSYLVEHQMKKKRNYATIEDVNEVLDDVVVAGTPHFKYIWDEMDRMERIVLLTLANVLSSQNVSTASEIVKYLQQYFFEITEQRVREIFEKFLKEDIIEQKMVDHYWFKIELIKNWCERNKVLHKLMEEIK